MTFRYVGAGLWCCVRLFCTNAYVVFCGGFCGLCGFLWCGFRRRRDRYDILCGILEAAVGGAGKGRLRSVVSLNHVQWSEYVGSLLENGLLEDVGVVVRGESVRVLRTTEKGREFVEGLRFLDALLVSDEVFGSPAVGNGKVLVCVSGRR